MTGARVEFRGLRRRFGSAVALNGLDLTVEPGELLALLGPSGCGKTTALRCVAGFEHPDEGAVLVDGADITRVPANRRDAGMVFQSYSLFPNLSARDNVAFGMRVRKVPTAKRHARAQELLELVGLPSVGGRYPHQLSGGQQQRVALARALALEPRVLLLDEPLSALDAKVRETLREEIRRLQLSLGITTIFVTHDQEEALSMADRVAVLRDGHLEQVADPATLYDRPATAFVAEFVGTMNHIPGRLVEGVGQPGAEVESGAEVSVLGQTLPVEGQAPASADPDVDVLVRPEAVRVTPDPEGDCLVIVSSFRGSSARLRVRLADGTELLADVPGHDAVRLAPGVHAKVGLVERPVLVTARETSGSHSETPPDPSPDPSADLSAEKQLPEPQIEPQSESEAQPEPAGSTGSVGSSGSSGSAGSVGGQRGDAR